MNKFLQSHNYTHQWKLEGERFWLNVCQKAKTNTWTHKQKKMIMCFCLPSFHLLIYTAHYCVACLDSFHFTFSVFVASSFSILLSVDAAAAASFSLKCFFVEILLLLLLRIKFRSTPCLWAWSQWPTTTGLLHIIPNSHTERLFLCSENEHNTYVIHVRMYIYILYRYMFCTYKYRGSTQLKPCELKKKDGGKKLLPYKMMQFTIFFSKTEQTLDLFHHKSNKPKEKWW